MEYPYRSQWTLTANMRRNDCGPAVVASVLAAFGHQTTVNEISGVIMPGSDVGTDADDLVRALQRHGVPAQVWTGTGYPPWPAICLVKYGGFDRANVQDTNYVGWHWVLVHSLNELTVVCHDPDFWGERINEGAFKRYSRREFDAAFVRYGQAKIAVVWPEVAPVVTNRYIQYDLNGNKIGELTGAFTIQRYAEPAPDPVRNPTFTATPGSITAGQSVVLRWSNTDGASAIRLDGVGVTGPSGSKTVTPASTSTFVLAVTYPEVTITRTLTVAVTPAPIPPPAPAAKPVLGVNNINSGPHGRAALEAGARSISVTFNPDWAAEIKRNNPSIHVACRGLLDGGWTPSVDQWWGKVWQAATVDGMCLIGLNENDHGVGTSPDDIRRRIAFDKAALARTKAEAAAKGIKLYYAGGGFSVGEPNILDDGVCVAMAGYDELMADPYFLFNQHLYASDDHGPGTSPAQIRDVVFDRTFGDMPTRRYNPKTGAWTDTVIRVYRVDWTMRRWAWYYQRCGWNPAHPGRVVCDETGLDIGSIGGFNAMAGCDDPFMQKWARAWVEVQSMPVIIDSVSYPSPLIWGNIFQTGDEARWSGYDIKHKLPALRACGWGQA